MLVLSGKDKDSFVIDGGRIVVTVVNAGNGQVRLGFDADKSIPIDRKCVHERKQRDPRRPDNRAA
jgi:carbon storage regulator CsrA